MDCVLTAKMFEMVLGSSSWKGVNTAKIILKNGSVVLSGFEDGELHDYSIQESIIKVSYDNEWVSILFDREKEIYDIVIKKNGVPDKLRPFWGNGGDVEYDAHMHDDIGELLQNYEAKIYCDLPELDMCSLVWLMGWYGSPKVAEIKTKRIVSAFDSVKIQEILKKLHGGLLIDIMKSRMNMFVYSEERYRDCEVPDGWHFDTKKTEFYTGTYMDWDEVEERETLFPCFSPFLFGGDGGINGMKDEILNHVDIVHSNPSKWL